MKIILIFLFGFCSAFDEEGVKEIVKATNLFASDLYKKINKNENFVFSPFSAEAILAATLAGCRNETAEELRNVLYLPNSTETTKFGFLHFFVNTFPLVMYNLFGLSKICVTDKFELDGRFTMAANQAYLVEVEQINFADNIKAAKMMNGWVEHRTNKKSQNLINPDILNRLTSVILINALYFKALWSRTFNLGLTEKQKFYKNSKDVVEVDTMHHYAKEFDYYECPHLNAKFLKLPFAGWESSMIFVLPNEKEGFFSLEKQIDSVFGPHNFTKETINVAIPKFKIATKTDLKEALKKLGVKKLFDINEVDLSLMAGKKGDLVVDEIFQSIFIDVNEDGVDEPAITDRFTLDLTSLDPVIPKEFIADHPFIFYIEITDMIAFAGKVVFPNIE